MDGAELIVEAIIEVPEAKRELYARLDACAPADAIFASNTSHLDVFPLIPEARQAKALIAHWYTPPYLVDLVDMIPGPQCEQAAFDSVFSMLKTMGKQPLGLKKFVPGYVANRIQAAIGLEVQNLLDEGVATAPEIDAAIIHGLALRLPILGFYAKADFTGLAADAGGGAEQELYAAGAEGRQPGAGQADRGRPHRRAGRRRLLRLAGRPGGAVRGARPPADPAEAGDARDRDHGRAGAKRMIRYELTGKTALVTGGASGIGLALVDAAGAQRCQGGDQPPGR